MHPIEYLRYLARNEGDEPEYLIPQAAEALDALGDDHGALVMGCRKLIEYHPGCGPLWWLCARALTAPDVHESLLGSVDAFEADTTGLHVGLALADADVEPIVCRTIFANAQGAIVPPPVDDRPLWVIAGVGTVVDYRYATMNPMLPTEHIVQVIGPRGVTTASERFRTPDAPFVSALVSKY